MDLLEEATPVQLSALWRLDLLSADEIAAVCMRWLEEGLDGGSADVAALAGRRDLTMDDAASAFSKCLREKVGRAPDEDEAVLRALHLHLAAALKSDDFIAAVGFVLSRFVSRCEKRWCATLGAHVTIRAGTMRSRSLGWNISTAATTDLTTFNGCLKPNERRLKLN